LGFKANDGFTLIETLVAIAILVAAITGPLTLASQSLFSAFVARDQMIASFLAQDAIEFIRYKRDTNFLNNHPLPLTNAGSLGLCTTVNGCQIDSYVESIESCTAGGCDALLFDDATGVYGYISNTSTVVTPFERIVQIQEQSPTEALVSVTVKWKTRSINKEFTVEEIIYDWIP